MRNDGTHILSMGEAETSGNRIYRLWLSIRGQWYTWWNKRRFGKVGKGFRAPGRISVVNGKRVTIGDHVFMGENCQIYSYPEGNIEIGNYSSIDRNVEIRGGKLTIIQDNVRIVKGATLKSTPFSTMVIGNRTLISAGCTFDGDMRIGEDVIFGPNVFINEIDHGFARRDIPMNQQTGASGTIIIEDDCWIGYNAVLLKGVHIEKGSIIGAGAIVNKSVPPYSINAGVPAKTIKFRD
jgi:acetyltransferase-like isoleucine patch superfamily enzyme